jgi:ketosteroid isomerase-like protein
MADAGFLRELNRDVWRAFVAAYAACDVAGFMDLYSQDLIRAGGPVKQVYGFDDYAAQTGEWFAEVTARGDSIGIEFRFLERIARDDLASERGIYKITAGQASGESRLFYGQFHTFARKDGGRWRIAVDYDSTEGGTITEATFAAAAGVDDVEAFAG